MALLRRCALTVAVSVGIAVFAVPSITHAEESGSTYVVLDGDTLIGIASKSSVRLADLLRANDMTITSLIVPGQRLDLPSTTAGTANTDEPTVSSHTKYTVRLGDTLSGIAGRAGVSLRSLLAANEITIDSVILPGGTLLVPATSTTATSTTTSSPPSGTTTDSAATYTVRSGDTLSGIAIRNGVSLGALLRINNMSTTSLIMPGMTLRLPEGATTSSSGPATSSPEAASTPIDTVVNYARAQVGKPYKFFTKGPDAFDCSGLTLAAYAQVGIDLIHYSAYQANQGVAVDFRNEAIQPGDLVFQARRGSDTINHVGIAVTSTTWIQAVGTGSTVQLGAMPAKSSITEVRRYIDG